MRVMIAEDSGLIREMLAELLGRHGFEVTGLAGTKDELLRLVAQQPPDAVVLDIRLPPGYSDEGLQAAEAIRASHPEVGLLVLSAYAETSHAVRLLGNDAGGVGYLVKDRVQDPARLVERSGGWPPAKWSSTPRSCTGSCRSGARSTRWTG